MWLIRFIRGLEDEMRGCRIHPPEIFHSDYRCLQKIIELCTRITNYLIKREYFKVSDDELRFSPETLYLSIHKYLLLPHYHYVRVIILTSDVKFCERLKPGKRDSFKKFYKYFNETGTNGWTASTPSLTFIFFVDACAYLWARRRFLVSRKVIAKLLPLATCLGTLWSLECGG